MSKDDASWVKWYPENFLNGVIGMEPIQIGVYSVLLNLIYANNGPIKDDSVKHARRCGMRVDHFERVVKELAADQKILRHDGVISNPRAEKELVKRAEKIAKLMSNLGVTTTKVPRSPNLGFGVADKNTNKNNSDTSPSENPKGSKNEPRRESEENKNKRKGAPAQPRAKVLTPTRIDATLPLSNDNLLYARSKGLTDREARHEWEKFIAYYRRATGKNSTSPDWNANWQSWVLGAVERLGRVPSSNGTGSGSHGPADYSRREWELLVKIWRESGAWHPMHGAEPGKPGSLVPNDLVNPG